MKNSIKKNPIFIYAIASFLILSFISNIEPTYAHGGKGHETGAFTPLMAVKKATEMFDKLISLNKLDETWETQLIRIEVSSSKKGEKKELVVSFKRKSGNPEAVYFFFDIAGKYTGSNFKGQ